MKGTDKTGSLSAFQNSNHFEIIMQTELAKEDNSQIKMSQPMLNELFSSFLQKMRISKEISYNHTTKLKKGLFFLMVHSGLHLPVKYILTSLLCLPHNVLVFFQLRF